MFNLNINQELTAELLQKIINRFVLNVQPKLIKWQDYYNGNHAILRKTYKDKDKVCNRIVTNFCKVITDTYSGYIAGKSISYSSNDDIEAIQDTLNYNDSAAADMAFLRNALIYNTAYELMWIDEYAQTRYAQVNPVNAFCIYDDSLNEKLLYFVRFFEIDNFDNTTKYIVQVYSDKTVKTYECTSIGGALSFINEEYHYFGDVPVSVFKLNESDDNIFNSIISLNDAYNEIQSCQIDDYSAFCDAYLTLAGMDIDKETVAQMREDRILVLPENGKAEWMTKNSSDVPVVNILENIKKNIFKVSAAPDMADDNFMAQAGVAIAYKLCSFENVSSGIVANFTKALQRRIELICNVISLKGDSTWRDIQINFVRNLPQNITETIQLINSLKGTVSDATLLSQLPFIKDVESELEAVQAQKEANMALFDFGGNTEDNDNEDVA